MFTTDDICSLCELPRTTLSDWVRLGVVKPALKGTRGRGNPNRYTFQQALGLAFAAALHSNMGCKPTYIGVVVADFGRMSEGALREYLTTFDTTTFDPITDVPIPKAETGTEDRDEEEHEAWCKSLMLTGNGDLQFPGKDRTLADTNRRMARVANAIREREERLARRFGTQQRRKIKRGAL